MRAYLLLILGSALAVLVACGDEKASPTQTGTPSQADDSKPAAEEASGPAVVGKPVRRLKLTDTDGNVLDLGALAVSPADAQAAVGAALKKYGGAADASPDTKLETLSGIQEDGEVDDFLKLELIAGLGKPFGLVATDETIEAFTTVKDLLDWVAGADQAPVLLMTWSPRCLTSKSQNDRILLTVAKAGARLFAIASNTVDTEKHYAVFTGGYHFPLRIIPDRKQAVTDYLGGKCTPHFFLIDRKGVLRYAGGLDDDPAGVVEEEERTPWLFNAIDAVRKGRDVPKAQTEPSG